MKKGFTMIELIFVIVILGILAAVAIPRLAATRDDAEISKVATNIQTLVSDLGAYYTSQGKWAAGTAVKDKLKEMTKVSHPVNAKAESCLTVSEFKDDGGEVKLTFSGKGLCEQVWGMPGLKQIAEGANVAVTSLKGTTKDGNITFGGKGVSYE
ncbi:MULTISPECIES: type II secretion system protein [unclassified Campylobacter]|uniref:type II secretion system protein n=1 Tax=unclassified Campylobacter TaxID=2593542 RepID=UPI0022E9C1BF|nr:MULTISPECIES: prepilin-type N-terminal cleavage/methylation domain-containing protein [unclassified Campylobacter]MDA3079800.1 prepilin-type N-terminal cleavage/methylation domain-containing protein [Campylobacter sp. CS_NA2]MDA3081440.1 prepilin-type N-terminal cleavage/methylation domain-containing protein [Campylobacter sp. CS_NA1]WBR50591.1 prepilin-type N-terminal cleavage/methylation domain-containing protein [Campylobacter sp. CS_NA3]